ncbi:hypothetical protein C5167_042888 [Papaver somniferum]|uniref:Uncharacterized protein n=1 Tax=Papaver somniferum TaxID=3469 RepID=A0A4Y7L440_PAPSO|nr:hypothetical protein C5167_042888 [Papaver somniferum]
MDKDAKKIRSNYTRAYLRISVNKQETPKYWLICQASMPPLGWNTGQNETVESDPYMDIHKLGLAGGSKVTPLTYNSLQLHAITVDVVLIKECYRLDAFSLYPESYLQLLHQETYAHTRTFVQKGSNRKKFLRKWYMIIGLGQELLKFDHIGAVECAF